MKKKVSGTSMAWDMKSRMRLSWWQWEQWKILIRYPWKHKISWSGNKANETKEIVLTEVEELSEKSSRNPEEKLESITVKQKEEDTMEEEIIFPKVEEETKEDKWSVMLVEK